MVFSCYQGMVQGKLFSFFPVFSSVALLSDCLHCHSNTNISTPSHPCINLSQKPLQSKDQNTIHVMLLESSRKDSTYASERLCIISTCLTHHYMISHSQTNLTTTWQAPPNKTSYIMQCVTTRPWYINPNASIFMSSNHIIKMPHHPYHVITQFKLSCHINH